MRECSVQCGDCSRYLVKGQEPRGSFCEIIEAFRSIEKQTAALVDSLVDFADHYEKTCLRFAADQVDKPSVPISMTIRTFAWGTRTNMFDCPVQTAREHLVVAGAIRIAAVA